MKRLIIISFLFFHLGSFSQAPENYYSSTDGKYGQELIETLHSIIDDHTNIGYSGLWSAFYVTDVNENGYVWDMYSSCTFTFGEDQDTGSGGTTECDVYNREHSFPASWFGSSTSLPIYSDLFNLYPTDKKVNAIRANYPYGEVESATYTSSNGSKLGNCSYPGYSGTVFEPIDEFKGDFARSYFYIATRYNDIIKNWSTPITNGTSFPVFDEWFLNMLIEWHDNDPVSQKEIDRNNRIYEDYQHNRNPFIDQPVFVSRIWSGQTTSETEDFNFSVLVFPNPVSDWLFVSCQKQNNIRVEIFSIIGAKVKSINLMEEYNRIDISGLKNGIYLVKTSSNEQSKTFRIIVSR